MLSSDFSSSRRFPQFFFFAAILADASPQASLARHSPLTSAVASPLRESGGEGTYKEKKKLKTMEPLSQSKSSSKEKKLKRKEALERKKAVDVIIKKAASVKDHLASFPPFSHYQRNGISVYLESGNGDRLSPSTKKFIQTLLKLNMEGPFGEEWPTEEKVKKREMVSSEARYIFIKQKSDEESAVDGQMDGSDRLVGFVHYRFVVEEELPVVYVYELQLESSLQGKGLGKFLMQLIELIARKNEMRGVVLTVQKANLVAMNFYTNKLRYVMSSISPTRVNIQIGAETSYEIYCKTFDSEAKATLE